jgi:hypothetical protein
MAAMEKPGRTVIHLPESLAARGSPGFAETLKREIERLPPGQLPLQQGLTSTSHALDERIEVMVIGATEEPDHVRARVGVFFSGILAGCSCADDPTPVEPQAEYCELDIALDKATGVAIASVRSD